MAQGDPSELREFIAEMNKSTEDIHQIVEALKNQNDSLEELDDTAKETIGELDDDLEKVLDKLNSGTADAIEEVERLAKAARKVSGERLDEAKGRIDEAETAFTSAATARGEELTKDDTTLTMEGFGALASDLNGVESALTTSSSQTDAAFDELESGLQGVGDDFTEATNETISRIGTSIADAAADETTLDTAGADCASAMATEGDEAVQAIESFEKAGIQYYEGTVDAEVEKVESDAEGLILRARGLIEDTSEAIENEVAADLEEPLTSLFSECFEPHVEEIGNARTVVYKAQSSGCDLEPLVDNLVRCYQVVDTIEESFK